MRADDDIYIKGKELERLLRRLNSSEPIVLGQTGIGNDQVKISCCKSIQANQMNILVLSLLITISFQVNTVLC